MGMDVYGKSPTEPIGEYFRNNVWWWRPLAEYVCTAAPAVTAACQCWQSNDGDGLDADQARQLAEILAVEIESGRTEAYAQIRHAELDRLPDESCVWCHGTGIRSDAVGRDQGMTARRWCNGCDGKGRTRPAEAWYSFTVENVREFVAFLRASGGFKIC